MKTIRLLLLLFTGLVCCQFSFAQKKDGSNLRVLGADSIGVSKAATDSTGKKKHNPKKATMHSLILPGWGQAYNRSYWKMPIVYAALGYTGYLFNYNRVQYNKVKYAYFYLLNRGTADSNRYDINKITDPALQSFVAQGNTFALKSYRDSFRKDLDYSVLFFFFFWALNVVDATVDGHLKDFDVSDDLSFKIKPAINALPNTLGASLVFTIGKHPPKHSSFQMP